MNPDNPTRINEVLETYTPVIFARVSSRGQKDSLPQQVTTLEQYVKSLGFPKKPIVHAIQKSGFEGQQQNVEIMENLVANNPKKKYVAVFRAVDRVGRDTEDSLRLRRKLSAIGVPMLTMDLPELTGKKPMGNRAVDILFNILSTVAETGKETELAAKEQAKKESERKGVIDGAMKSFYPEKWTKKGKSLHRQIWMGSQMVKSGIMSKNELARRLGFVYAFGKEKGKGNTSQIRKVMSDLEDIHAKGGNKKLNEYLDVVDAIVEYERVNKFSHKRDRKPASLRTPKSRAMHRVTVAYLRDPFSYPNPITEGNPLVATIVGNVGIGTVADAFRRPERYLTKKV